MSITILNPGALTTVQDLGRTGYQRYGMPVCGVCDPRSAKIANILVNNPQNEAVLECTLMGPSIRFETNEIIAITGADLTPLLDRKPVNNYSALEIKAGQVLSFAAPKCGCRAYIAFAGGLDIDPVMGSRSTFLKAGIGGFKGRKLQKDDVIGLRAPVSTMSNIAAHSISPDFKKRDVYTLHVIMGTQKDAFTKEGIKTFLGSEYKISAEFDRMGARAEGPAITHKSGPDILSDGIAFGAIQVPGSGMPIIMLADRQTTGGYTKIATVISYDHHILGQLKSGDRIRFEEISVENAHELMKTQADALKLLEYICR